jgi:xanthine dehydrogenase accessory factor
MGMIDFREVRIIIKGAGEMASGIAHRLFMSGMRKILMTEIERPLCIRRPVSFAESVYEGECLVEGVKGKRIDSLIEIEKVWKDGAIGVIVDPNSNSAKGLSPHVIVDAIMAKRHTGTKKDEAPIVICVGPGFRAPEDCHAVIESQRGHNLGRVIYEGEAEPHTGIPAPTMGYTEERVLRAPRRGMVRHIRKIGDFIKKGDTVLYVDDIPVFSKIDGVLRGLIREIEVSENEKIGDVDPRMDKSYCYTISDKARAIGGGVLEAILHFLPEIKGGDL